MRLAPSPTWYAVRSRPAADTRNPVPWRRGTSRGLPAAASGAAVTPAGEGRVMDRQRSVSESLYSPEAQGGSCGALGLDCLGTAVAPVATSLHCPATES